MVTGLFDRDTVPSRSARSWLAVAFVGTTGPVADHCHIPPVDNLAVRVDVTMGRSFFFAHPVDGIAAGRRAPRDHRSVLSPGVSPARTQRDRRVYTSCPQACAQSDWTPAPAAEKLSEPQSTTVFEGRLRERRQVFTSRGGGLGERCRTCPPRGRVRAHPAAGHRGRAVRPRRHAAVQGRHRRRRRGHQRPPDFYRPAHQIVHEAILDLYGRGEPADAVTVSDG